MIAFLRKYTPKPVLSAYHFFVSKFAALIYGFPSNKMFVIGVTGTYGKSTTAGMISKICETTGHKVGLASTIQFQVGEKIWLNKTKMTMIGRFQLQKLLKEMVDTGCKYAIIETTSEGIRQHRHKGINYDMIVFTLLKPEHIESHGGFENYKKAKGKLFTHMASSKKKNMARIFGESRPNMPKTVLINLDDEHADYYLTLGTYEKWGFTTNNTQKSGVHTIAATTFSDDAVNQLTVDGMTLSLTMIGKHNLKNALAAYGVAKILGIDKEKTKKVLEEMKNMPGRLEFIENDKGLIALVDFAFEPATLALLYESVQKIKYNRLIQVFGQAGGGRDKARRPIMGRMATEMADIIILTNEDPFDDDPMEIINEIAAGAIEKGKVLGKDLHIIPNRGEAIQKAVDLGQKGDLILVSGKGCEQAIVMKNRQLLPWDDRTALRKAFAAKKTLS